MSETQARGRWEINHCDEISDDIIKCKNCPNVYSKSHIVYFTEHLYNKHHISELTNHPNREFLENVFSISVVTGNARCNICGAFIHYKSQVNGTYLLQNHYEIFHGDNVGLFNAVLKVDHAIEILNNFILIGKKATCRSCELQFDIEHFEVVTLDTLTDLFQHFFSCNR